MGRQALTITMLMPALAACAAPRDGDPCSPGDEKLWTVADGGRCEVLFCHDGACGPSDCDGEPRYRWEARVCELDGTFYGCSDGTRSTQVCGCDGQVHELDQGVGGPANVPWRWYGGCEGCEGVSWDGDHFAWRLGPRVRSGESAVLRLPQRSPRGDLHRSSCCTDADGLSMPAECCQCDAAMVSETGTCLHGTYGFELPSACCE